MLNAGTETGSLVNHLYSRMTKGQPAPVAGMGATLLSWSDRHAATVFRTWTQGVYTYVEVRQDHAAVTSGSGHDGSAAYAYRPNIDGARYTFRQRKDQPDSSWQACRENEAGRWVKCSGGVRIGQRESYRDPSF